MGEEGGVSELLKARGIVRHDVGVAREIVSFVAVAVESLVRAGVVAEMGSGPVGRDGALRGAGDGRGVVGAGGDGDIGDVLVMSQDQDLAKQSRLL